MRLMSYTHPDQTDQDIDCILSEDDTSIDLMRHVPSGELYIAQWASAWQDDCCVGCTITGLAGPVPQRDYLDEAGQARNGWINLASEYLDNQMSGDLEQDAAWAQGQVWQAVASSI